MKKVKEYHLKKKDRKKNREEKIFIIRFIVIQIFLIFLLEGKSINHLKEVKIWQKSSNL